jgi:hypothetical protein
LETSLKILTVNVLRLWKPKVEEFITKKEVKGADAPCSLYEYLLQKIKEGWMSWILV